MRSALPLAAVTIAVAVLLSGCVPVDPEVTPPPEPSTEPIFASDEEALAAATDAYAAYLAMSDLIAQEGGVNPERIAPYVTEEWLERELTGFSAISNSTRHQVGASAFEDVTLQHVEDTIDYKAVTVYVCHDATGVRIFDSSGMDVTPPALADPWKSEVTFEVDPAADHLLLAGNDPWVREDGC
ncbi:hypothetical protein ACX3O0_08775 [Homoserinimonas sp. A447]